MSDGNADFVDDIVPDELPRHIEAPRDDFKPWHKVRKQFIRERQWNPLIATLVQRLRQTLQDEASGWTTETTEKTAGAIQEVPESLMIERPLRLLVIPGDDLLDLRSLWKEIQPFQCYMRYLGFNSSQGSTTEGTRVYVSNNEVTSLSRVATNSQVLHDRFQAIANQKSTAYHYLREYGPFHVVNLDLCDSLFPTASGERSDYYNALHRLAEYQMKNQTTPWLLFITTQVEPGNVQRSEFDKICEPTRTNCETHSDFSERLNNIVPAEAFQSGRSGVDISKLNEEHMIRLFGVGLGKWLMQLAGSASPQWFVDAKQCYRYGIREDPHVEMLSFAFLFRPNFQPPIDTAGLSSLDISRRETPSELASALRLISMVEQLVDVDHLLNSDDELRHGLESASADLMASAGFDREKYLQWPDRYYG